jgi:DNA polymerase-3 subunit beta
MQVVLPRAPLVEGLRLAERLLPARSPDPLLQHVLLRADGEDCTLLAHDREVALWLRLAAQVGRPGSAMVPGRRLLAVLRVSGAEAVRLGREGDDLCLRAPGLTCRLLGEDPARFPEPGPFPARAHALVPADSLEQAIRRTLFAAAPGPGYCRDYLLEAVLCEVNSAGLRLVASDNRRLAVAELPVPMPGWGERPRRLLLSVKALGLLGLLARDQEGPVRTFFGPPQAFFRVGRATLAARLQRGRFPDWQAVLPAGTRRVADLPVGLLLEGVRQAAVLREPTHARLVLRLEPGRLELESRQAGAGSVFVEQEVSYAGEAVTVAFDPAYLMGLLRALGEEGLVRLELDSRRRAALFVGADGYRHVLVPLQPDAPAPEPVFPARQTGRGSRGRVRSR